MASMFNEDGTYNKTNWKAGDKITAGKLNKIEESLEAINNNDISRHAEADARLDVLEEQAAGQNEVTNERIEELNDLVLDIKDELDLDIYDINARMTSLVEEINEGIEEVYNVADTVDGKIAAADASMKAMVAEVEADLEGLHAKDDELSEQLAHIAQKKIYQFDCVETMKRYDLKVGEVCETLGYYNPNDGGGAKYLIKENLIADEGYIVQINNKLFAELVIENNTVNFKQLGARSQTDNFDRYDNASYLELYINKLKIGLSHRLYIPAGVYYFSPCTISGQLGLNIEGDYDFANGYIRGTVLKPLLDGQTHIWQLGSSNEYLTNFSINNMSFSTANTTVEDDGISINTGALESIEVALKLINAQFGKIGDVHFTGIKGKAMNICSSWEIDFNKLFFRAINSRDMGVLVFDTVDTSLNDYANITCCNFRYVNFEAIMGDCIQFKKSCRLSNSSFGVINVEDNKWGCGSDGSSWVTFNTDSDEFNEDTDEHRYILRFEDSAYVRGVNFKTIEMNNVCSWYNLYNNKKTALDGVMRFGTYGEFAISINDINIQGFNKDIRVIHLLNGDVSWYSNSVIINNIYSNNTDYKFYFDVAGLSTLKVNNIYNRKGFSSNNIGIDLIPFSEIYHGYTDCGRGHLYYDSDSINKLKLVVKPITHLLSSGSQRNRTIGSLYVKPNAKLMFRAKANSGTNVNVRFDGWGAEKSVVFTGDDNWHWYILDLEGLFDIPTLINIKTHYDSKYDNIDYYLDCFKII